MPAPHHQFTEEYRTGEVLEERERGGEEREGGRKERREEGKEEGRRKE